MRNIGLGMGVVVVVLAVLWWQRARVDPPPSTAPRVGSPPSGSEASARSLAVHVDAAAPPRVRRLAPAERAQLANAIARARAHAAETRRRPDPKQEAAEAADADAMLAVLMASLGEIKPFLKECHEAEHARTGAAPRDVHASLTLIAGADVGALIENGEVTGPDGAPLAAPYAECLRETLASLALPGFDGDEFRITMDVSFDEPASP